MIRVRTDVTLASEPTLYLGCGSLKVAGVTPDHPPGRQASRKTTVSTLERVQARVKPVSLFCLGFLAERADRLPWASGSVNSSFV